MELAKMINLHALVLALFFSACVRRPMQDPFDAACPYGRACPWCDTCASPPRK